jgi:hypothetical protein
MVWKPTTAITARVDEVLTSLKASDGDWIREFVKLLTDNFYSAERAVSRTSFWFLVAWLLAYLIGVGAVREIGIGPAEVTKINYLLILAPMILGFLSYSSACSVVSYLLTGAALHQFYNKKIPKLEETGLTSLLARHGFLGAESMLTEEQTRFEKFFALLIVFSTIFLLPAIIPLLAIFQTMALVIQLNVGSRYLTFVSCILGLLFWFRGAILLNRRISL